MGPLTFNDLRRIETKSVFYLVLVTLFLVQSHSLFAEGTRELLVNNAGQFDTTKSSYTGTVPTSPANMIQIWDQGPSPGGLGRISGTYSSIPNANEKMRYKIRVCRVGEVINIGFNPNNDELSFWRLYRPDGTCVRFDGTAGRTNLSIIPGAAENVSGATFTYRVPRSSESTLPGYIRWYSQAAVGPAPACSTVAANGLGVGYPAGTYCGYNSIKYVVTAADMALAGPGGFVDFFIAMNGNDPINTQTTVKRMYAMLDVTVWDAMVTAPTQPVVRKARFYSAAWDINCNGLNDPAHTFNSTVYFYSRDSVVTSITFNRMRPFGFLLCANATGTANTGVNDFDRRSRIQFNGAPDYPIFLNNPFPATAADRTCGIVPKSSFGNVTAASITGCDNDRCINLTVDRTGIVGITLMPPAATPNAFTPRIFNNSTVIANTSVCIPWDGLDGAGNPIIGTVTVQINYFNGLTNLPLFDVEHNEFGYVINLIAPTASAGARPILVYWDDRPPAGTGVTNFTAGSARDGFWDNDNNALTPDINVGYNNFDPVDAFQSQSTYHLLGCDPSVDHSAATAGNQGCHLWFDRGRNTACPTASGINCAETHNTWWNANVIERTVSYTPSNVKVFSDPDAAPAPVGTGNTSARVKNFCVPTPVPINGIVKIDPNITSIPDANDISDDINGTGRWSIITGSGSFGSAATNLVNTYVPDAGGADLARGFVLLRVTSDITAATPCGSANDTLRINLFTAPDVWTRPGPITVCANNALVRLDPGIVGDSSGRNSIVSTFRWTPFVGGTPLVGGTFVPNNQSLGANVTYTPPASFTSGTIVMRIRSLTLTTPSHVICAADSAQFNIVVNPIPVVNAQDTLQVCNNGASTTIPVPAGRATINGGTGTAGFTINWTGAGSFTGGSTLTPTYTPTASERASGIAKIVFNVTQTSVPSCAVVRDTLIIAFTQPPTANAGSPFTACKNNLGAIPLNGSVTNATTSTWSFVTSPLGGTGTFANPNNPVTSFTNTGAIPNTITFTLTATRVGCPNATSTVTATLTDPPVVDITPTFVFYCPESPSVVLTGTGTGEWFANKQGTIKPLGTFAPNDQTPNATYTLAPAENTPTPIALYFVGPPTNGCLSSLDSVGILRFTKPVINLPPTQSVCVNQNTVNLSATIVSGSIDVATIQWTSLGASGSTFTTSSVVASSITTTFTPTASDKSAGSVRVVISLRGVGQTNCDPVRDTIQINFTPAPVVSIIPDTISACINNPVFNLAGAVSNATGQTWSASPNNGSFSSTSTVNTTFTASSTSSSILFTLTATSVGCNPVSDQIRGVFTPSPTGSILTAPPGAGLCKNNPNITSLSATSSTGSLVWSSSSGCSTCFSNVNSLTPTYTPSATDLNNNQVVLTVATTNNGNCNSVVSTPVTFTFVNSPTVTPGTYSPVCENNATMTLNGAVTGASGGSWSSASGCVSCFSNPNNLSTTYTPSAADIAAGSVTFTLVSTGNISNCQPVQGTTTILINDAPTVNAGPDLTVCTNQNTAALTGATSTNTSTVVWSVKPSAGTGTITNPNSLFNAVYNITAADKANGTAILVLTGNGNPGCSPVTDERIILFTDLPTANVGPDRSVCLNDASASSPLILDATGSSGGTWSCAGCSNSITNSTSIVASYVALPADANQTRIFTYTVPAAGACPGTSDAMNVSFLPAPTVTAGGPYTLCGNSSSVAISGTVTNATGVLWTTSGTGSFGNNTATSTFYTPSQADTAAGSVTLTIRSTGNGLCSPATATAVVTILDAVRINAGADQNRCFSNGGTVPLTATVQNGTFTSWSILGAAAGIITSAASASTTYTMGAGDAGNTVTFIASSTSGNPACPSPIRDTIRYTFINPPTVAITTPPGTVCQTGGFTLAGSITGATTGIWSCTDCSQPGTFSPDNTFNNLTGQTSVQFTPHPSDTSRASITFQLVSTSAGVCASVQSGLVTMNLEKRPRVNAGPDRALCNNNNVYTLQGSMTNSATGIWKAGISKFTGFSPSNAFPGALTYDPDTVEVQTGFVTLTLISTGTVACPSDSDKVTITFTPSPLVNAGFDRTVCVNNPTVNLVGTISLPGFTPSWNSPICGTTCFSNPSSLLTSYTLNAAEQLLPSVQTVLTAIDPTGLCAPVRDTMRISLTPEPVVNITTNLGADFTLCSDSAFVILRGTSSTGALRWTSDGSGTFQPNAFDIDSVLYPFTVLDRTRANLAPPNNRVKFYLESQNNNSCLPVRDSIFITLDPAPVINITTGDSTQICANINTVSLTTTITPATFGVTWNTSGTGSFAPPTGTSTTYTLTPLDKAAGTIVLVPSTIAPPGSTCKIARDQYKVKITPLPTVNPGANLTVCQDVTQIDLSDASVTDAGSVLWTTSGTGVFGPDATTLGAGSVYYPTFLLPANNDVDQPSITLTLAAVGCSTVTATRTISFTPRPNVETGTYPAQCNEATSITLSNATASNNSSVSWTRILPAGGGSFTNPNVLNAIYNFNGTDKANGFVTLVLTANGNGSCAPRRDTIRIDILPQPTIEIGTNPSLCSKTTAEALAYTVPTISVTNGITPTWTTTGLAANLDAFNPLSPTYTIDNADIANGSVSLIATTRAAIGCQAVTDALTININRAPTIDLGPDINTCADLTLLPPPAADIQLISTTTNAGGLPSWISNNTGVFSNPNIVNPIYTPVASEDDNGLITKIFATVPGVGSCPPATDSVSILFNANPPAPIINDTIVCFPNLAPSFGVQLNSGITGTWAAGSGTFSANPSNSPIFTVTPPSNGTTITVTFTPSDACFLGASTTADITYITAPSVTSLFSTNVCNDNFAAPINLPSTPLNNSSVQWTVLQGLGTLGSASSANATYSVDPADFSFSSILIKVTATGTNPVCGIAEDTVEIFTHRKPVISISNQTVCLDLAGVANAINLTASVSPASGSIVWLNPSNLTITGSATSVNTTATATAFPASVEILATGLDPSCANLPQTLTINAQTTPSVTVNTANVPACTNGNVINLNGTVTVNNATAAGGFWSKVTGSPGGIFSPNAIGSAGISYTPSAADLTLPSITLRYTITDVGVCTSNSYSGDVQVNFSNQRTVTTSPTDITFCAQGGTVPVTAIATPPVPTTAIQWAIASGSGTFTASTTASTSSYLPSDNPTNVPAPGDVQNGGAILIVRTTNNAAIGCPEDSALVALTLVPVPAAVVNAGINQRICRDNASVKLQGLIINASGGIWRTLSGSTSDFSNPNDLEATYTFTAADKAQDTIRLTLTSIGGNALCTPVTDTVDIIFTPTPVLTATASVPSVCEDVDSIPITGTVTVASVNSGVWSSLGDGYFTNINEFDLSPVYVPGPSDIATGNAIVTITSTNNGNCIGTFTATDTVVINKKIKADAGPDQIICANNMSGATFAAIGPVPPPGSIVNTWTVISQSDSLPHPVAPTNLQMTYFIGDSLDLINEMVSFRFKTTGSGCKDDSSDVLLKIAPAPRVTVNSPNQTICADASIVNVNVTSIQIASQGIWTSTGTGTFTNPSALTTTYNLSQADRALDSLIIFFTTTDNISQGSQCGGATDGIVIQIDSLPVVSATAPSSCIIPAAGITLTGIVTQTGNPAASAVWSTNSTGTPGVFSLDPFTLSPRYFPSLSDENRGSVTLTLSSANAGTCGAVTRSINLNVAPPPIADAGADKFVCQGNNVTLAATAQNNITSYVWAPVGGPAITPAEITVTTGPVNTSTNFVLTVTDTKGCISTDTVLTNAEITPVFTQALEQCYDFFGYVKPVITGTVNPLASYQWTFNNQLMSNQSRDSVRVTQPGLYQLSYTIGACNVNSSNATNVLDLPRITTPDYVGCEDGTVLAQVSPIPNTGLDALGIVFSYNWNPAGVSSSIGNPITLATSTTSIDTLTYRVTSSYSRPSGITCTYLDSVRVISVPRPDPRLMNGYQACENNTITLDVRIAPSNITSLAAFNPTYQWYTLSAPTTILGTDVTYSPTSSNDYGVRVTVGQCIDGDSTRVDFRPLPPKTMPASLKQCFEQVGSVNLDAGAGSAGAAGLTNVTYDWFSDGTPLPDTTRIIPITYTMIQNEPDEQLLITVNITNVFDTLLCPVSDTTLVDDVCVPKIFPPTVFHPGDGNPIDAEFTIKGKYFRNFKITVFSRWGEIIFYSEDPTKHWDGTYRGELMPIGVYAYTITYEGKDEETKGPFKKDGRIVLVR